MKKELKEDFELNILGLLKFKTENGPPLTFWQKALMVAFILLFVITIICLLKQYIVPVLAAWKAKPFFSWISGIWKKGSP